MIDLKLCGFSHSIVILSSLSKQCIISKSIIYLSFNPKLGNSYFKMGQLLYGSAFKKRWKSPTTPAISFPGSILIVSIIELMKSKVTFSFESDEDLLIVFIPPKNFHDPLSWYEKLYDPQNRPKHFRDPENRPKNFLHP